MQIYIYLLIYLLYIHEVLNDRRVRSKYEPRTFTSCFDELGCIDTTEKWYHEKFRPKNLEPLDRHTIRTEFLLMKGSKNNSNELLYDVMNLKKETVQIAGFKTGTCSIFVIHDFTSNGYTGWIKHLVIAFNRKTDCNIISVDWQAGAEPPFLQAIANARVVALETKAFLTLLACTFSQSTDNIHLIGHGVGAHIAGYVGKYIKGIQRITGLDPTGPMFERMPKDVRIDVEDARYVEILHTDCFNHRSQGGRIPHGHVDFIINNADHQPGCNDSSHMPSFLDLHRDTLQEGKILPACSHKRAFKYYIQAVEDDECQFIGIKCDNFVNFQLGMCSECNKGQCATFGLEPPAVTSKNNTYYLITNGKKPFCLITYAVNITIPPTKTVKDVEGFFEMILIDVDDKVTNATNNVQGTTVRKFSSGHTYKFIFYGLPPRLGKVKEAKVKWVYKSKKICIMCDKSIHIHDIGLKRLSPKNDSNEVADWICPVKRHIEMKSGDYVEFANCMDLYGPKYLIDHVQPNATNQTAKAQASHAGHSPVCISENETNGTSHGSTEVNQESAQSSTSESTDTTGNNKVARGKSPHEDSVDPVQSAEDSPPVQVAERQTKEEEEAGVKEFKECFQDVATTTAREGKCENMAEDNPAPLVST